MKRILFTLTILFSYVVISCSGNGQGQIEDLEPTQFKIELEKQQGILIDVRTEEEFNTGYLEGAINYDVNSEGFIDELDAVLWALMDSNEATDVPVFVYCKAGGRSSRAAGLLIEKGYKKVYNLKGGITSWQGAALPVKQ